jgi:hypothetical protein
MKCKKLFIYISLASTLSIMSIQAHATAWLDFDQAGVGGTGISTDSQNPTVLNQVTVVCPANGFLVATATSDVSFRSLRPSPDEDGPRIVPVSASSAVFSISRQVKVDLLFETVIVQDIYPGGFVNIPSTVQRVEACKSGETVTYFHTAHGSGDSGANRVSIEGISKLVVEFFDKRI